MTIADHPWYERPPMEGIIKDGSFRAYGHTIGPAQRDLERWIAGRPLTPGLPHPVEEPDYNCSADGILKIEGIYQPGCPGLRWSVIFAQAGRPDRNGLVGGAGSAEDACDQACALILEEEAERALLASMPGLA